jgi:hypothetical protein
MPRSCSFAPRRVIAQPAVALCSELYLAKPERIHFRHDVYDARHSALAANDGNFIK